MVPSPCRISRRIRFSYFYTCQTTVNLRKVDLPVSYAVNSGAQESLSQSPTPQKKLPETTEGNLVILAYWNPGYSNISVPSRKLVFSFHLQTSMDSWFADRVQLKSSFQSCPSPKKTSYTTQRNGTPKITHYFHWNTCFSWGSADSGVGRD